MSDKHTAEKISRRRFLATAAATAATVTIVKPSLVRGSAANSTVELGVIGCGGRGGWITNLFNQHKGFKVVSAGDYFKGRVEGYGKKFGVDASRRHWGLSCHKKVLADKVDAVAIESPPYFHPMQAAAAVEAGKHVYVAKPIAVDVPGCTTIAEAGKKATAAKLVFLIDFQTRADEKYQETVKRVSNGDIGRVISGEAVYYTGLMFGGTPGELAKAPDDPEVRLRHWCVDQALSGDIITEQNIHALDVATWFMGADPVSAVGTGGRKVRKGDPLIYDHFNLVYEFPKDLVISFSSKQYGKGIEDIGCWIFGSRGTADTHYFGHVKIHGDAPYGGGNMGNLFTRGAANNIATFHKSITEGIHDNPTVAPSVRSNLTTVLGRIAAYRGAKVTWDEMIKANEKVPDRLEGLKG